jgi:hypothetical protein
MNCPICSADGIGGSPYVRHVLSTKNPGYRYFRDERGGVHLHDPNTSRVEVFCRNGHRWVYLSGRRCQCGWGAREQELLEVSADY